MHLIPLLKAILARTILEQKGNDLGEDPDFHRELIEERNAIFKVMLDEAVTFCNNKRGENWNKLKGYLKE